MKLDMHFYGDPVLRAPAERVAVVTEELRAFAADMVETMRAEQGVGLAAPQVGRSVALCVVELPEEYDVDEAGNRFNPGVEMPMILFNPVVVESSAKLDSHEEGCLSFPGMRGNIDRPIEIVLRFWDERGVEHEARFVDFLARVIQHEVDHLNGVLFIDRMSAAKRFALSGKLKKLKRETEERLGLV
ncbi:MAG: peptide deformylase [Kiritimatiellae bacterium]|nr:peptide deformylase [Kiritimatiellia bacterium]